MKTREYLAVTQLDPTMKLGIQFHWIDNPGNVPNIHKYLPIDKKFVNSEHLTDGIQKELLDSKLYGSFIDLAARTMVLEIDKPKEPVINKTIENSGQMELPFIEEVKE